MKARKWISLALILGLVLALLAGCGASTGSSASKDYAMEAPMAEDAYAVAETYAASNSLTGDTGGSTTLTESRKWIITVDLTAETEDLDALLAALGQKIAALNGYVEDQSIYNGSTYSSRRYRSANLTVRVPAGEVDAFTEEVSGISNVVRSNKSLEDVTLRYTATENRVAALETEEARLLELMEQAETMADLLEIEARLTDVRYELEQYSSQLRLYNSQIDYATIYVSIEEVQEYTPVKEQTTWERISEGFVSSLKGLGKGIVEVFIWVIVNLPYLILWAALAVVVIVLVRRTKKRRAAKKAAKTQPKQEPKEKTE